MSNRHLILCGGARLTAPSGEWQEAPALKLRLGKGKTDVHLRLSHIAEPMCANLPEVATDLVELAAYVYTADQAVRRGGKKEFEYGRRYRRHFRFEVPVRRPEVWRRREVSDVLCDTLGFLSYDDYEFGFVRLDHPPTIALYLFDPPDADAAADFEEVLLFSGGLDSLGGAVREVLQANRRVALVSHRPTPKIYARQCHLVGRITELGRPARLQPLHVAVEVNKGKPLGVDYDQRARSFLFASVAAVVARLCGLTRIRFYENGVVSLNLPVSPQVLGARASRTTHPQVLKGFERLLTALFEQEFRVENPFLWKTKAQVVEGIKTAGFGGLCALTSSCSHTWAQTSTHPQCGRCSGCIERRLAALAAGLSDAEDPRSSYRSDVLTGSIEGADLILAERYVGMVLQADQLASPTAFVARFPEVARALAYVDEQPARAAELAHGLYREFARNVQAALTEACRQNAEHVVARDRPINSLLGIVCSRAARAGPAAPAPAASKAETAPSPRGLTVDPETFEARYGERACFLGNNIEFRLLVRLNRKPGYFVSINSLRDDVWHEEDTEKNTIQRTISNLRRKLCKAEMSELVIDGSEKDHYRLVLPG
jgi:hypothetical protein